MCRGRFGAELSVPGPLTVPASPVCDVYLLKDFNSNRFPSTYGQGGARGWNTSCNFKKHVGFLTPPPPRLDYGTVGSNPIYHQEIFWLECLQL